MGRPGNENAKRPKRAKIKPREGNRQEGTQRAHAEEKSRREKNGKQRPPGTVKDENKVIRGENKKAGHGPIKGFSKSPAGRQPAQTKHENAVRTGQRRGGRRQRL